MTNAKVLLSALLLTLVGCAGADPGGATTVTVNGLRITESSDTGAHGTFTHDGVDIRFTARMLTPDILDMTIEHSGMTLTYTADYSTAVAEFDGYVTETGAETQMTQADRDIMLALAHEMEQLGHVSNPIDRLRGFASVWAEFPSSLALRGHPTVGPDYARHRPDRWYEPWDGVQVCDHLNSYLGDGASHDCNVNGFWQDNTTIDHPWLSWGSGPTYFWNGNAWVTDAPHHDTTTEYMYNDCMGRCGADCGGGTFTLDCVNHDQCVRDGDHVIYSGYCDDQFLSTTDDYAFAPNC